MPPAPEPRAPTGAAGTAFRSAPERLALGLVILAVAGFPLATLGYRLLERALTPTRVVELTGRLPTAERGGWTPERIVVRRGERVRLRLTSADVVHGFAIPKLGVEVEWVEPGRVREVELRAERAGRYAFLCTVWCQLGHWRMRGVLEVLDPDDPGASARDVDPPRTDWVASGLDLDADHRGASVPAARPDAARGAALWATVADRTPAGPRPGLDLRRRSPSDVYALLSTRTLPGASRVADLTPAERWDVVASLWYAATTPGGLRTGARLYDRDCTGCHGTSGRGDGPGAVELRRGAAGAPHGAMARTPVDFTDLAAQAGAPDLLYYGKLVRGGMGTSMPYWGTIYREEELWAVVAHLRSFAFRYPDVAAAPTAALDSGHPRGR